MNLSEKIDKWYLDHMIVNKKQTYVHDQDTIKQFAKYCIDRYIFEVAECDIKYVHTNNKMDKIHIAVSKYFGINPDVLLQNRSRVLYITIPKHISMFVMRQHGFSLHQIGNYYTKDHATVLHAERKIQSYIDIYPEYHIYVSEILNKLN